MREVTHVDFFCFKMSQNEEECKEVYIELLECYRNFRCLWDTGHSQYSNRECRNEAYNYMLEILKRINENATVEMLKKKLENMRTCYKREMKKVSESAATSIGNNKIRTPRLWYFDHMTFLDEKDFNRSGTESLYDENDDEDYERVAVIATPTTKQPQSPQSNKRRLTFRKRQDIMIEPFLSSREDDWDVIGRSIGLQLKHLEGIQQAIAQKLMSDVLYYGKRNKLTDFSTITLSPSPPTSPKRPCNSLIKTEL